jgi:transcriptional regulator with XRE-family HTH domain
MSNLLKLVGTKIRDIRKQKGLSQEQLGELASFHFSYIGGVERGETNISLNNLDKIAKALDVEVYHFFSYVQHLHDVDYEKESIIKELLELMLKQNTSDLRKIRIVLKELL